MRETRPVVLLISPRDSVKAALQSQGCIVTAATDPPSRESPPVVIVADFAGDWAGDTESLARRILRPGDAIVGLLSRRGHRPSLFLDGECHELDDLMKTCAELLGLLGLEEEIQTRSAVHSRLKRALGDPALISVVEEALAEYVVLYKRLQARLERRSGELERANRRLQENLRLLNQAQEQLIEVRKMAAVGQLAGGVAHELNNPIGVILGFAQSLTRGLKANSRLALPLKTIEREATRCSELVQNLLTFSRASGRQERAAVDLNVSVEQALSLVLTQTKARDIQVVRKLCPNPPKLRANKNQLQQAVVCLCNNAIDAMPKGGELTIRTGQAARDGASWVWLEVSDTGTGIPKEVRSRIFEPFFTTKEVGKGRGLGLALVHEIVQRHGGTIGLSSEEGKGATFTTHLPALANEEEFSSGP